MALKRVLVSCQSQLNISTRLLINIGLMLLRLGYSLIYTSFLVHLFCSVPQGSDLGPLIFILYMADVADVVQNCQVNFADLLALSA